MKKKGFTLIELLAVIVILAIIALIATPFIMTLIGKARFKSAEDSAYGIIEAGKNHFVQKWADSENYVGGIFNCSEASKSGNLYCKDEDNNYLEYNGVQPTAGELQITSDGKILINRSLVINGYNCNYKEGSTSEIECNKGSSSSTYVSYRTGKNDEVSIIYYNPVSGEYCDINAYNTNLENYDTSYLLSDETKSPTELKTGCMKWYAIENSDSSKSTVNVILDHNTTALASWGLSGTVMGTRPYDAQTHLDKLVSESNWQVTPRLIDADELASIVGNTDFSAESSTKNDYFYFDTENGAWQTFVLNNNRSNYAWLYNNVRYCTYYGCDTEDDNTYTYDGTTAKKNLFGYWTSNPVKGLNNYAWCVDRYNNINYYPINGDYAYGVRPVITITKPTK